MTLYSGQGPIWEQQTAPFNELILSWNCPRPKNKPLIFSVEIDGARYPIAEWGAKGQKSLSPFQDILTLPKPANSFTVHVANMEKEVSLYASVSLIEDFPPLLLKSFLKQSQMQLNSERKRDLCSPTSATTALHFLTKKQIDPVDFAKSVKDEMYDIYGNWSLNVAECFSRTGVAARVERLADFAALYEHLKNNRPVIVSVKGPIKGAPLPYSSGHLMCVIGYEKGKVHCIDSAFPTDEETFVSYDLDEFIAAWGRRRNLAYTFT